MSYFDQEETRICWNNAEKIICVLSRAHYSSSTKAIYHSVYMCPRRTKYQFFCQRIIILAVSACKLKRRNRSYSMKLLLKNIFRLKMLKLSGNIFQTLYARIQEGRTRVLVSSQLCRLAIGAKNKGRGVLEQAISCVKEIGASTIP